MWYNSEQEFKEANGHVVEGVWYPRVTKIIDVKAKPALENFFKEMESFALAETVKNKSAEEGSLVHATIEAIVKGMDVEIPESIRPAVDAFRVFYAKRRIQFHPDFIERSVWSRKYRYAGTVDALAAIDGKFGVLDIKTSSGIWGEYKLQTAAYFFALREFETQKDLALPRPVETRWILRVNQHRLCARCLAVLREKGGRKKITQGKNGRDTCEEAAHEWGNVEGDIELKEFTFAPEKDMRAFMAAKILWEWENDYWLRKIGYA